MNKFYTQAQDKSIENVFPFAVRFLFIHVKQKPPLAAFTHTLSHTHTRSRIH